MFRIAFCDDRAEDLELYRQKILHYAKDILPDVEVLTYQTQQSLLFAMEDIRDLADIIFLDIRMPGTDGIELTQKLRRAGYQNDIVFLTESEEDMLRAFDVGAFNYMVKGKTSDERAKFVISKAIESALKKNSMKLLLSSGGETRSISVLDVRYFEVRDHLIVVHYGTDSRFTFISAIGKIENRLEKYGFVRTHRAYLVSCRYIRRLNNGKLQLDTGDVIPVSRSRYAEVRRMMEEFSRQAGRE